MVRGSSRRLHPTIWDCANRKNCATRLGYRKQMKAPVGDRRSAMPIGYTIAILAANRVWRDDTTKYKP
jgi:hypothetical protein